MSKGRKKELIPAASPRHTQAAFEALEASLGLAKNRGPTNQFVDKIQVVGRTDNLMMLRFFSGGPVGFQEEVRVTIPVPVLQEAVKLINEQIETIKGGNSKFDRSRGALQKS